MLRSTALLLLSFFVLCGFSFGKTIKFKPTAGVPTFAKRRLCYASTRVT